MTMSPLKSTSPTQEADVVDEAKAVGVEEEAVEVDAAAEAEVDVVEFAVKVHINPTVVGVAEVEEEEEDVTSVTVKVHLLDRISLEILVNNNHLVSLLLMKQLQLKQHKRTWLMPKLPSLRWDI
jgi:hypothetical protein